MNVFVKDLLNVVTGQEAPDFNFVLSGLIIYLILLWLAFCIWVFVDAKRRYSNIYIAIVISLVVFILNFPALIFYLVVRPEDEHVKVENQTGVEVPVVRFIDEQGNVRLALNLEISGQQNPQSDMTVSVAWDSSRQDIDINRKKRGRKAREVVVEGVEAGPRLSNNERMDKLAKLFSRKKNAVNSDESEELAPNLIK